MAAFSRLVLGLSAVATTLAVPTTQRIQERGPFNFVMGPDHPLSRRAGLRSRSNTNYNQDYTTGGTVDFTPSTNAFSVNWDTTEDFVVGVGWQPGSTIPITHTGTFTVSSGLGSLSVYGWSTNPLVEYYVMESDVGMSAGTFGTVKGTVTSDGGTYTVYENQRVNEPSIEGTSTFNQYISVRTSGRSSGTVTIENHFNAWASYGMNLGTLNYQVIAVESWDGSGSSQQSVTNTGSGSTNPTTTTSAGSSPTGGSCSALYGQCGGIGWTGATCCAAGSTCQEQNSYFYQCLA